MLSDAPGPGGDTGYGFGPHGRFPMVCMEEAFGNKDLFRIDDNLEILRVKPAAYGAGGKPLRK